MTGLLLRGPADVLGIVPYLIGFHPASSLVVVGTAGRRVVFAARCDLPVDHVPDAPGNGRSPAPYGGDGGDAGTGGAGHRAACADAVTVRGLAARVARIVARQRLDSAILVGYGPAGAADPVLAATGAALRGRGVTVRETIRAHGGRYWCPGCSDPACCPPDGTPYDVTAGVIAAEATLAGLVALPDRAAVDSRIEPAGPEVARSMAGRIRLARSRAVSPVPLDRLLEHALAGAAAGLDDDRIARLLVLLEDGPARDHARRLITPITAPAHLRLWQQVLRRTPPGQVAPVLILLAYAAWRTGDGTLAGVALDRALPLDPGSGPARYLDAMLRAAAPPDTPDTPDIEPPPGVAAARARPGCPEPRP